MSKQESLAKAYGFTPSPAGVRAAELRSGAAILA